MSKPQPQNSDDEKDQLNQHPGESDGRSEDGDVSAAAAALGRRGGLKGGPARAAKLSPEERKEIARKAARARWDKGRDDQA